MKGNFDGSSEQGERGESPTSEAINGILANGNLKLFRVEHSELEAKLSKVQRLSSLKDEELEELLDMFDELEVFTGNATRAIETDQAFFGIKKDNPEDPLYGNEEVVMERTRVLAAKNEQVALIFNLVRAEKTKRQEAETLRKREAELDVYEKVYEGLSREQILEKLLEYMETLIRLQEEIPLLERDVEYSSEDIEKVLAKLKKARKTFYETQRTIAAGKRKIGKSYDTGDE